MYWSVLYICVKWMSYFLSGRYIQYICISLLNYPHRLFWKWNKDREMWQSHVILWHWSSTLFLAGPKGIEAICRREETAPSCYPSGGIHTPLTQGWMTRVNNSEVGLVSSPTISVLVSWCKLKSRGRDGSRVGLWLRPGVWNTTSGASFIGSLYNRFDRRIKSSSMSIFHRRWCGKSVSKNIYYAQYVKAKKALK